MFIRRSPRWAVLLAMALLVASLALSSSAAAGGAVGQSPQASPPPHWLAAPAYPQKVSPIGAYTGPDGRVYVFGGNGSGAPPFTNALNIFDPTKNAWTTGPHMKLARGLAASAMDTKGRIYVFGGVDNQGNVQSNSEMYDPRKNAWTLIKPMPTPRFSMKAAMAANGKIYVMGGTDRKTLLNLVEVYDPATNAWSTATKMPIGLIGFAATTRSDGNIYAMGGCPSLTCEFITTTVLAFTPGTARWKKIAPLTYPRYGLAVTLGADGRLYAIGGSNTNSGAPGNWVEAYSFSAKTWHDTAMLSTARSGLAAATLPDGRILAMAGATGGQTFTKVVEAYGPVAALTPTQGKAGARVTVTGSNFGPFATVRVRWGSCTGTTLGTGKTDGDGKLTATIHITIPTGAKPGTYTLFIVDDNSHYPASKTFTVTK